MSAIKKIVIFGSTGNTGLCAVRAAVNAGLSVRAFVRNPDLMSDDLTPSVELVEGDVTNAEQVDAAVEGQDGVVILLGTRNVLKPTTVMSDGTKNILNAMSKHNVQPVSACLSAFLFWEASKIPPQFAEVNADHERMLAVLRDCDRQWVAVLPPHIADEPGTGNYSVLVEKSPGRKISKHDLGEFMVKALSLPEYRGQRVGLANPAAPAATQPMPDDHKPAQ